MLDCTAIGWTEWLAIWAGFALVAGMFFWMGYGHGKDFG